MSTRSFIGSLAGEGLGDTLEKVCAAIATGDPTTVAAEVGSLAGGSLVATGVLVGGAGLQITGNRKLQRQQREQFEKLGKQVEACKGDIKRLTDLLVERSEQPGSIVQRVSAADLETLRRELTDAVRDTIRPLLPEGAQQPNWDGVFTYLDTNTHLLRELSVAVAEVADGIDRIEAQLPVIANAQQAQIETLTQTNAALAQLTTQQSEQITSLHEQLMNANRELADQRLQAGRSVDEVLAELRDTDPRELFAFLVTTVDDDESAFEQHRAKLIDRHREIAAIGFPLGKIAEAERSLLRLLELIPGDLDATNRMGHLHRLRGELNEAVARYTVLLGATDNPQAQAAAFGNLGLIEQTRGNLDTAEDYLKRSLAIDEQLGRKEGMANQLGNLGLIEQICGNLDAAEDYLKQSLAINEQLGRKEGMADQLGNLGNIQQSRGNLVAAEDYHKQSLAIDEQLGNKEGIASDLGNLGEIERIRGNPDAAEDYLKRSLAINEQLGRKEGMAIQLGNLGLVERARGNLDAAEDYHKQSLAIDEQLGNKEGMAIDVGNLGLVEWARGNLDAACGLWKQAFALFERIGMRPQAELVRGWIRDNGCDG